MNGEVGLCEEEEGGGEVGEGGGSHIKNAAVGSRPGIHSN